MRESRDLRNAYGREMQVLFPSHPQSGVGRDFHSLPCPLDKLPKQSWKALNQGDEEGAVCAKCAKPRPSTPHQRKLFLVAERLSWETGVTPYSARSQNEIALWAVNAELDIFDPAVEDEDTVHGGKQSRENPSYPFKSEAEAEFAMRIVARAEILTSNSWEVWKAQCETALNSPLARASAGPGSAAEPLQLSSDESEDGANHRSRTTLDNHQQANAVHKLLRDWSKTDTVLKSVMDCMEKKVPITQHGAQIFNGKVEAAMKAVKHSAVLEVLFAKARSETDFRALTMAVSKGIATAQTRSLFKSHVRAVRRAVSDTRPPLQDVSPVSIGQKGKGKKKAAEYVAPPVATKRVCSYQTLQDFYSLLDKIERTSPMGAKYLEAYAARLHAETCKDCWFDITVLPELGRDEPGPFLTAEPTSAVLPQRTGLATDRSAASLMDDSSHAQGYVDRYRARHGEDPPPDILRQYAPKVPPRPSDASQHLLLPDSSAARQMVQRPVQQRRGRLPTDIVFPTPEQLGLPSASPTSGRAPKPLQRAYASPHQSSPTPRSAKGDGLNDAGHDPTWLCETLP